MLSITYALFMFPDIKLNLYVSLLEGSSVANQDEDPDTDREELDIGDGMPDDY